MGQFVSRYWLSRVFRPAASESARINARAALREAFDVPAFLVLLWPKMKPQITGGPLFVAPSPPSMPLCNVIVFVIFHALRK